MDETQEMTAYVVQLRAEHCRLHELLRQIEDNWPPPAKPAATAIPHSKTIEMLIELRAELAMHFRQEEEGGCLEEAVSRCPRLGGEADRIEHEHPSLLAELDGIIEALSRVNTDAASFDDSHKTLEQFARKLHAHEAAENRLLEEAFGIEDD